MERWFAVEHLDLERLLAEWRWLCWGRMTLVARNACADLLLRNESGQVFRLEVGVARLRKVADSEPEFRDLAETREKREEWVAEADETSAANRGLTPNADQCIGFSVPLVLAETGTMCAQCRRTKRLHDNYWDWVPEFLRNPPARVSCGICRECLLLYCPDSKP